MQAQRETSETASPSPQIILRFRFPHESKPSSTSDFGAHKQKQHLEVQTLSCKQQLHQTEGDP